MKKRITALLLSAALVLSITACGKETGSARSAEAAASGSAVVEAAVSTDASVAASEPESAAEAASEAMPDEEVLARIDEVNSDFDSILADYGSMLLYYDYVQTDVESEIYLTADSFLEADSDGYVLYDDGTQVYGRDSRKKDDYFKLADFNEEDEGTLDKSYEPIPWYTSDLMENSAEVTTQDGMLIVTLTVSVSDDDRAALAGTYEAASAEEISSLEYRLEADPDTMLIQRIVYSMVCGSTGILLTEIRAEYGGAQPRLPSGLQTFLRAADVRSITVILNPGTDDETTFTDTIRKGCSYKIVADHYDMYADAACTEPYTGSSDLTQDITLYLKSTDG